MPQHRQVGIEPPSVPAVEGEDLQQFVGRARRFDSNLSMLTMDDKQKAPNTAAFLPLSKKPLYDTSAKSVWETV